MNLSYAFGYVVEQLPKQDVYPDKFFLTSTVAL